MPQPLVALSDVKLTLNAGSEVLTILHGVDITIEAGETVAIVGPSGSGKTSLLTLMAGLQHPSAGEVSVAGQRLNGLDENALALFRRENVGIIFQSFHLIPTMTALENVAIGLELQHRADAEALAWEALSQVGLAHRVHHYPGQLSGGEQQRVAIARAFAPQPKILLADEPTGNLDHATGEEIVELLFALQQKSRSTLILITHDAALAKKCRRTLHVFEGAIVREEVAQAA